MIKYDCTFVQHYKASVVRAAHMKVRRDSGQSSAVAGQRRDTMANLGLIITNQKYESEDLDDLPKVAEDAKMMKEMLSSHDYEIELYPDVEEIGNQLEKFQQNVAGREIDRLHFHFSGHGVHNARIQLEPDELERMKERGQSDTKTTKTPVGRCLVGTTGKLYSVHDLKRKLLECGSTKITITLDCCRTQHRGLQKRRSVKLKEKLPLPIAEQEKIAVISGALDLHPIDDKWSLTKELYEVSDAGTTPILLIEIAKKVNASWKRKGIEQRSKIDLLEDGENWAGYMWPTAKTQPESEKSNEREGPNKGEGVNLLSEQIALEKMRAIEEVKELHLKALERSQARLRELFRQAERKTRAEES